MKSPLRRKNGNKELQKHITPEKKRNTQKVGDADNHRNQIAIEETNLCGKVFSKIARKEPLSC